MELKDKEKVYVKVVESCSRESLMPIIQGLTLSGSTIYSDGWKTYDGLILNDYEHHRVSLGSTFCNHAVFITVMAVDGNYKNFTNRTAKDDAGFPEYNNLTQRKNKNIELKRHCTKDKCDFYYHKISNYWCDILAEASRNESTGIKEVNLEQAQKLANQGFVVIVCHKNLAFRYGAPHFATIRPDYNVTTYTTDNVKVANVGIENKVLKISDENCFKTKEISLYYNKLQHFEKNLNIIKHF